MIRFFILITFLVLQVFNLSAQCPATISSLGQGNGLQICWPNNQAPAALDSITYDNITYAGHFVNAGQGDCWRTTSPATLGTNGNHQITFVFNGTNVVCEIINGIVTPVPVHLSVDFLYYTIKTENNVVQILWETAKEENNDYFAVERSQNGIDFEEIAQVSGVGVASAYQYEDLELKYLKGTYYYRLKQVDFDGTSEYTAIRTITLNLSVDQEVRVFPNPAKDHLYIILDEAINVDTQVSIFSVTGQLLIQQTLNGVNETQANYITLSGLSQGCYIAKIESAFFSKTVSFVKQ